MKNTKFADFFNKATPKKKEKVFKKVIKKATQEQRMKPTAKIIGDKKSGYVISIYSPREDYYADMEVRHEELLALKKVIDKKLNDSKK